MRTFKRVLAITLAAATLISLAACSPYKDIKRSGGITEAQVEQIDTEANGIEEINFYNKPWYHPGEGELFSSRGMNIRLNIKIKDGYRIDYPEEFLKWAAGSAWSVNSKYPKGNVIISIENGISNNYDWHKEVREVFKTDDYSDSDADAYSSDLDKADKKPKSVISLSASNYGEIFGRWPGKPAPFKKGMISQGEPEKMLPKSIDYFRTSYFTVNKDNCYVASANRNKDDNGNIYSGKVTIDMFYKGKILDTQVSSYDSSESASSYKNYVNFKHCSGDEALLVSQIKFKFTTENKENFEQVSRTIPFEL